MALTEICAYLRNWFDTARLFGTFTIENGSLADTASLTGYVERPSLWPCDWIGQPHGHPGENNLSDFLQTNQYFRIVGSVFNDGVHKNPATGLQDETFKGALWVMAVPPSVITLNDEIDAWQTKFAGAASSPFSVESVTASSYSRTKATGDGLGSITWQKAFGARLGPWRKI